MIKFFRKIRQRLVSESKFSKYLLYALGEIVLVVIGILMALQINNWNENRINNNKLENYLFDIVKDLKKDIISIRDAKNEAIERTETTKSFLANKDYNTLSIDSLEKNLETFYTTINFSQSTFKKIESSGITNFGEYEYLVEAYKDYNTFWIPYIKDFEGTHNRAVDMEDNYWRYNQTAYEFTYEDELHSYQSKQASKENLVRLLQSPTARNILKTDYRRNKHHITRLDELKNYVIELIEATEKKLNDQILPKDPPTTFD
jgi:hypothetical protein